MSNKGALRDVVGYVGVVGHHQRDGQQPRVQDGAKHQHACSRQLHVLSNQTQKARQTA